MDEVVGEVDFFGGPGGGLRALVELPDLRVLDRKHAESIGIWGQEWFFPDRGHDWNIWVLWSVKCNDLKIARVQWYL